MAIVSRQYECCHLCGQEKWGLRLTPFSLLRSLRHMFTDSLSCVAPLATQRPICLILVMDGFSVDTIFGP